jgi:chromosome segregation ATPase
MFNGLIYKVVAVAIVLLVAVGYVKYTQDKLASLNQQVATKQFALNVANETIAKQQADIQKQQDVLKDLDQAYQSARNKVDELEAKFHKNGRDLETLAKDKPQLLQDRANRATKKVFKCLEDEINKGQSDESC